jgi:hypothetical protein
MRVQAYSIVGLACYIFKCDHTIGDIFQISVLTVPLSVQARVKCAHCQHVLRGELFDKIREYDSK